MKELDTKIFRYSPCFEIIAWKYRSKKSKIYDKVFGVVYRYCQLNKGVCYASVRDTLSSAIGVTPKIFGEALQVLIEDNLIILVKEGNTNSYIVNTDEVERLLSEMTEVKNTSLIQSAEVREELLRGEVEITSRVEEKLPQSEVETTLKERESLRENLRNRKEEKLPETSATPPLASAVGDSLVSKEEINNLKKELGGLFLNKSKLPVSSASKESSDTAKVEESRIASSDIDISSESIEQRVKKALSSDNLDGLYESHLKYLFDAYKSGRSEKASLEEHLAKLGY